MNIHVIACLHGEEVFGLKIIAQLQAINNPHVTTHIAHPEAIAKRTRYLDADLNRSFSKDAKPSRERDIAKRLLTQISKNNPDIVLDLHTSHGKVGKVAITASDSPLIQRVAAGIGMEQVAVMPATIAKQSLIGQLPHKALSIEFGIGLRSDKLARRIAERIVACAQHLPKTAKPLPTYYVERLINNHEAKGQTLHNYVFNATLQGYPFLVGKNTYSQYRGFLATKGK